MAADKEKQRSAAELARKTQWLASVHFQCRLYCASRLLHFLIHLSLSLSLHFSVDHAKRSFLSRADCHWCAYHPSSSCASKCSLYCCGSCSDRGGTFCDFYASCSGKTDLVFKLLSVDPGNYQDAPTEGIRRIIEHFTGESIPRGTKIPLDSVESVRMGTTVATNALLERNGERCALLTSYGYRDVLRIGTQGV